jgi:hypothetical protein
MTADDHGSSTRTRTTPSTAPLVAGTAKVDSSATVPVTVAACEGVSQRPTSLSGFADWMED